jgi:phosphatidylethanolamine/phosphatidyl-N-methylethanolamine N-methyltransferase
MGRPPKDLSLIDITKSYRRYAPIYDWLFGHSLDDGRKKIILVIESLRPSSILEMGVGTGLLLPNYPNSSSITGIDISHEMLTIAQQRISEHKLENVTLVEANCENTNMPDNSFDCVVIPYVLSVTPDPASLAKEAIRLCSPHGRIIIANHFSGSKLWLLLEKLISPLTKRLGFRSNFSYQDHIEQQPWTVESSIRANFLGLSKVLVLKPIDPQN